MRAIWGWMAGRKTYLLAGGVLSVLLALVFLGRLTPDVGVGLVTVAVCGFGGTFRHALERHQQEEIAILRRIAQAGAAAAVHNVPGIIQAGSLAISMGEQLAQEVEQEK